MSRKMPIIKLATLALTTAIIACSLSFIHHSIAEAANIPNKISYQGKLLEAGIPVTGYKNITFTIGTWTDTLNVVITNGLYSVTLGSDTNPIPVEVFDNGETMLQISIEGTSLPQTEILSSAYAFISEKSNDSENLDGQDGGYYLDWNNLTAIPPGLSTTNINNWNTAFGWGDHSLAGYLTSYAESDPTFASSAVSGITAGNINNWNAAFNWGDHSLAGYLTSYTETDPKFSLSAASGITPGDIGNWNTAYGWGDHLAAGYLTELPPPGNDMQITYNDNGGFAGSEVYFDKSTGNVGIGETTPDHKLDVGGAVQATEFIGDGSQLTGIWPRPGGILSFHTRTMPSGSNTATSTYVNTGLDSLTITPSDSDNIIFIQFGIGGWNRANYGGIMAVVNIDGINQTLFEITGNNGNANGGPQDPIRISGSFFKQLTASNHTIQIYFRPQNVYGGVATCTQAYLQVLEYSN